MIRGDAEEKVVYKIIEEAGNKGTWIRDIRVKSNLAQAQLTKVLKSLKQRKLVKEVKCVNSTRKIVYMVSTLEPDRSVTGGAWYSDQGREGSRSLVNWIEQGYTKKYVYQSMGCNSYLCEKPFFSKFHTTCRFGGLERKPGGC